MAVIGSGSATHGALEAPVRGSTNFVEWGPVFAGAVLAASLSLVMLTFGSAIGLSMASPWPDAGAPSRWILSLAAFWAIAQQIGAFLAGGYIAGRMRARAEVDENEGHFRDGLHGGLVWAVGIAIGSILAASAATSVVRPVVEAGRGLASAAPTVDQMAYFTDSLLRPGPANAQQQPGAAPPANQPPVSAEVRQELARIFARSAVSRDLSAADRAYIGNVVAQRTGLSPQEAEKRVTDTFATIENSIRDGLERTRRTAALAGFVAAISIVIGFAAAWWGGVRGGQHRDNNFTQSGLFLRPRTIERTVR